MYDIQATNAVNLPINAVSSNVVLTPGAVPVGAGATNIYLLQIEFFQMVNLVQYSLKDGAHNTLCVVEVT